MHLALLQSTQRCFNNLEATLKQINRQPQDVTIATTTYVAVRWLSPGLAEFCQAFPAVQVLLQHNVTQADTSSKSSTSIDLSMHWQCMLSGSGTSARDSVSVVPGLQPASTGNAWVT